MASRRMKSRAIVWAQRLCLCIAIFAAVNWLLNVMHWRWVLRYDRIQAATWMGCLEVNWYAPQLFPIPSKTRAELTRGGVTGRNGLATVLSHIQWMPRLDYCDANGQVRRVNSISVGAGTGGHTRATLPMWSVGMISAVPYVLLVRRARRRRAARLCDVCDYSLIGLSAGQDGLTLCPECGSRVDLREVAENRA